MAPPSSTPTPNAAVAPTTADRPHTVARSYYMGPDGLARDLLPRELTEIVRRG